MRNRKKQLNKAETDELEKIIFIVLSIMPSHESLYM